MVRYSPLAWLIVASLSSFDQVALVAGDAQPARKSDSPEDFVCRLIESSAQTQSLPVNYLTRLIWQESSFRSDAISPAGAQGVAQFMPGTANERGLADPFDPEEAIPKAAELLSDLSHRFGNFGLAAAAYNAGPARVENWRAGHGDLPAETRNYVAAITGHSVEDWNDAATAQKPVKNAAPAQSCLQTAALIRRNEPPEIVGATIFAPWGVQLAGSFSKPAALAAYARAKRSYPNLLGNLQPMIMTGRMLGRGASLFYAIRAPAPSRGAADSLCKKIMRVGGACAVLRS